MSPRTRMAQPHPAGPSSSLARVGRALSGACRSQVRVTSSAGSLERGHWGLLSAHPAHVPVSWVSLPRPSPVLLTVDLGRLRGRAPRPQHSSLAGCRGTRGCGSLRASRASSPPTLSPGALAGWDMGSLVSGPSSRPLPWPSLSACVAVSYWRDNAAKQISPNPVAPHVRGPAVGCGPGGRWAALGDCFRLQVWLRITRHPRTQAGQQRLRGASPWWSPRGREQLTAALCPASSS